VFIYTSVRACILSHWLFVLLLYAFTTPAAAVFFSSSSSSPLSFFLISHGTDNNNEAERTKTELYMTLLPWHAFIVRTCQKKAMERKRTREKEKDSRFFFVFYYTQTNCIVSRWLTIFLLLSYTNKKSETNGQSRIVTLVDVHIDDQLTLEWLSTRRKAPEWLIYEKNTKDKTMRQSSSYNRDRMVSKLDWSKNKKNNPVTLNDNKNWIITSDDDAQIYRKWEDISNVWELLYAFSQKNRQSLSTYQRLKQGPLTFSHEINIYDKSSPIFYFSFVTINSKLSNWLLSYMMMIINTIIKINER